MKILLVPAIVLGCALLGMLLGGIYFIAVVGLVDRLGGHASSTSAAWQQGLGFRASSPAFAIGIPAGAWAGSLLCNALDGLPAPIRHATLMPSNKSPRPQVVT